MLVGYSTMTVGYRWQVFPSRIWHDPKNMTVILKKSRGKVDEIILGSPNSFLQVRVAFKVGGKLLWLAWSCEQL